MRCYKMKRIILSLLFISLASIAQANSWSTAGTGNWTTPGTWTKTGTTDASTYPGELSNGDDILVNHAITLNTTGKTLLSCSGNSSGSITNSTSARTLTLTGTATGLTYSGTSTSGFLILSSGTVTLTSPVLKNTSTGYAVVINSGSQFILQNGYLDSSGGGRGISIGGNTGRCSIIASTSASTAILVTGGSVATTGINSASTSATSISVTGAMTITNSGSANAIGILSLGTGGVTYTGPIVVTDTGPASIFGIQLSVSGALTHTGNITVSASGSTPTILAIGIYSSSVTGGTMTVNGNLSCSGSGATINAGVYQKGGNLTLVGSPGPTAGPNALSSGVTFSGATMTYTGTQTLASGFNTINLTSGTLDLTGLALTVPASSNFFINNLGTTVTQSGTSIALTDNTSNAAASETILNITGVGASVSTDYILTGHGGGTLTLPLSTQVQAGTVYGSLGTSNTGSLYIGRKP